MTYEEIVGGLRQANFELQREGLAVRAGHKQEQATAPIVEKFAWLFSDEALQAVDLHLPASDRDREARKRVRAAILQGIVDRRVAAQDDALTTFYARANVDAGEERLPFYAAQSQLTREPDPRRREALGAACAAVMAEADDLALSLNAGVLDAIRQLGYESYIAFWSQLKEVDYQRLADELARVAGASRDAYRQAVEPWMAEAGYEFGACPQSHMSYFRSMRHYDSLFRPERLDPVMKRTFADLGLALFSSPQIHIDLEDRPSKHPRASVWVPEAGVEVHLLTRPTHGHHDYGGFLHEAGHALHFGLTDPSVGWPLGNLGRSMAYAELWSYLVEHIGFQPGWIEQAIDVDPESAARVAADVIAVDMMMFFRYVGKLAYELQLYAGDPLDPGRGRELYARTLSEGTGFVYDPRQWQFDRDPGFYSADYLRAWLAEAALEQRLREMFGERWWSQPETGAWLMRQWKLGSIPEAEDVVAQVGGRPWSGEALLSIFARRGSQAAG